ncbi:MAG: ABC transporter permease subunit [Eubacteriales bacterium]|nr:ABC transporter permease subunit [Eubacteriales bacterium]
MLLNKYRKIISIAISLLLWQGLAMLWHNRILLVGPIEVVQQLLYLLGQTFYWQSLTNTNIRILLALFLAMLFGIVLAMLANSSKILETLLWPYVSAIKASPLASVVVLSIVWVGTVNLSVLSIFLIVFPIVYGNILEALRSVDPAVQQMLQLYKVPFWRRVRVLYVPHTMPFLLSTCKIAVGMAFKAGVAAELIGLPKHTVGSYLYEAKIYLSTADLFAWTFSIVLISMLAEKVLLYVLHRSYQLVLGKRG